MMLTPQTQGAVEDRSQGITGARRALIYAGTRLLNPLVQRFAGSRAFPLFALVRHEGRRSGRPYITPVGARRSPDGFVIPLTFGERADWFRNVQALGQCVIRWRGREYLVVAPQVVGWSTVRSAFYAPERVAVPLLGITAFVRLRHANPLGSENDAGTPRQGQHRSM
jgi:deazaflavin-dependent oxidoreductase (nitroreductase family)